jgi:hypothetical protein
MVNKFDYMNKDEKPSWNMALFFLVRLDERLNDRDNAFNDGDLLKCYRSLRTIYANVHYFFKKNKEDDEDEKILEDKFHKAAQSIINMNTNGRGLQDVKSETFREFQKLLDEITLTLYDLLHENNLVFPEQKFRDKSKSLSNSFM